MSVRWFQTKNLLFVIKMTIYGLKIIGLAPFAVLIKTSAQINPYNFPIQAFESSKIGLAYNIIFLIPVLIAVASKFYFPKLFFANDSKESSGGTFDAGIVVRAVEGTLVILTACIVIISWGWNQKDAASIMNRLLEIDGRLSVLKQQPYDRWGPILLITLHVIINAALWITFWVRIIVYGRPETLVSIFFTKIPDYIIYWFIIEYMTIVGFLAQYLRTVNKHLLDFNEFGNYLSRPRIGDGILIPAVTPAPTHRSSQLSSLQLLHSVRTKLSELCGDIEEFFSLPILFCITCCFIPIVRELYVVSTFSHDVNVTRVAAATYVFLVIFLYVYPVISLALNVTRTGKEAGLTGQIVHKLLTASTGGATGRELTQFSLQLLHEDIKFTAYRFFTLDSTLLLSMMGGIASYFVALMQFQSACTCKSSNNTSTSP